MSDTELRKQLLRDGFEPVPVSRKKPVIDDWNDIVIDEPQIDRWGIVLDAPSTGLRTRRMPTFDVDILDKAAAEAAERMVRERFEDRGKVLVRIGEAPKRAVPFRTDKPFPKIVIPLIAPDGYPSKKPPKLEFLGDGQQVVGFGKHPDTRKPYVWHGINGTLPKLEELPLITQAEAQELMDDVAELLCEKFGYKLASESSSNGKAEDWDNSSDSPYRRLNKEAKAKYALWCRSYSKALTIAAGTKAGACHPLA
jgi:Bifunctional DNA primase/polymerase, N-terminal